MPGKYYVYGLIDPIKDEIFYIGKGCGYRAKSHFKPSLWKNPSQTTNPYLYGRIKGIFATGSEPSIKIFENELTEHDALDIESKLIANYGTRYIGDKAGLLLNIMTEGSHSGKQVPWSENRRHSHQQSCKARRLYDPTYDELFEDYVTQNKSRKTIAFENNCSDVLVKKRLQSLNITKPKNLWYPPKNIFQCLRCEKEFTKAKSVQSKYCSSKCFRERNLK